MDSGAGVIARAHYWLLRHPRIKRPLLCAAYLEVLCAITVALAPNASAATNAAVLNWTGLHDSYNVPIGDFTVVDGQPSDRLTNGPM